MKNSSLEKEIQRLRKKIDSLDEELLILLNRRTKLAQEIGKIKQLLGIPVYSPEREAEIMELVQASNKGPLSKAAIRRLFERIIDESRSLERSTVEKVKKSK